MNRTALYVALFSALLGACLLYLYKERFEAEASGGERVAVLTATKEIPLGARVTEEALAVRYVPENYVEERHIRATDMGRVIGVRAGSTIRPNESVLWSDLATTTSASRKLAGLVRVGMRAVTIPITETAFGGLLRPGDRVDAVLTSQGDFGGRQTAMVAQNMLVLAVGADIGQETGSDDASNPHGGSVTMAATVEEGQRLILAATQGRMSLLLRNPDDVRVLDGAPEVRANEVLAKSNSAHAAATPLSLAAAEALRDQALGLQGDETPNAKRARSHTRETR